MGRSCECCHGSEICKNENSKFATPWKFSNLLHLTEVVNVSASYNSISGKIIPLLGGGEIEKVPCSYYYQPLPNPAPQRPCFNCLSDLPGSILTDPFGADVWCGYYAASVSGENLVPYIFTTFEKVFKIKSGSYTVNTSGFDSIVPFVSFSKKCFIGNVFECSNIDKTYFIPTSPVDSVIATIESGPNDIFYFVDCITGQTILDTIEYPFQLSNGPFWFAGLPTIGSSFTFTVPEDCFFFLRLDGRKISKIEITSKTCLCPAIADPVSCFRPPRTIHVLDGYKTPKIDPYDFSITINGNVEEIETSVKYIDEKIYPIGNNVRTCYV